MWACQLLYAGFLCIVPVNGENPPLYVGDVKAESGGGTTSRGVRLESEGEGKGEGWKALVVAGTDNLSTVNPKVFSEACVDGACARYHFYCRSESDFATDCDFAILRDGSDQPAEITLTSDGVGSQRAALRSLIFVTPSGVRIPLAAMSQRSKRESPYCARTGRSETGPLFESDCAFLNR